MPEQIDEFNRDLGQVIAVPETSNGSNGHVYLERGTESFGVETSQPFEQVSRLRGMGRAIIGSIAEQKTKHAFALRKLRHGAVVSAYLMFPSLTALTAVEAAAHFDCYESNIAGLDVTACPVAGSNTSHGDVLGLVPVDWPQHQRLLGKDIGVNLRLDAEKVSLAKHGQYDAATILDFFKQFSDLKDLKPEINKLQADAQRYYEMFGLLGLSSGVLIEAAVWKLLKVRRKQFESYSPEIQEVVGGDRKVPRYLGRAGVATVFVALLAELGAVTFTNTHRTLKSDPVLIDTPFKNGEIGGPFKEAIDEGIPGIKKYIKTERTFYDQLEHNLRRSLVNEDGTSAVPKEKDTLRVFIIDDLQGKIGMAKLTGITAKLVNADIIVFAGDVTATGSGLEPMTIDTLKHYSGGIPTIYGWGAHDSLATIANERKSKALVADNTIHSIKGITALSIESPLRAPLGGTIYPVGAETKDEAMQREINIAIAAACAKHPQLLITHFDKIGQAVAQTGCVREVIDGREYYQQEPHVFTGPDGTTYEYTSGSTGGLAANDGTNIGVIHNTAPAGLMDINLKDLAAPPYYRVISYEPDTNVHLSPWQSMDPTYIARKSQSARRAV